MEERIRLGRNFLKANWESLDVAGCDQARGLPPPLQEESPPAGAKVVSLVPADELRCGSARLIDLIRSRKSRRKYGSAALSLEELSFLVWAAQGIRERKAKYSLRTVPSGGARHPFDLCVFVARVEGLETGLYRYLPFEHSLVLLRSGDDSSDLDRALLGQYWNAAAVFFWAAVPYRTEWRYSVVAHKLIALDAGHSCQNLYLASEALGCGTCAIGAYDQAKLDAYLGLDGEERFAVYAAPLGKL